MLLNRDRLAGVKLRGHQDDLVDQLKLSVINRRSKFKKKLKPERLHHDGSTATARTAKA